MNIWDELLKNADNLNKVLDNTKLENYFVKKCGPAMLAINEFLKVGKEGSHYKTYLDFLKKIEEFIDYSMDYHSASEVGKYFPEFAKKENILKFYDVYSKEVIDTNVELARNTDMTISNFMQEFVESFEHKDTTAMLLKDPQCYEVHKQLVLNTVSEIFMLANQIAYEDALKDYPVLEKNCFSEKKVELPAFIKNAKPKKKLSQFFGLF